MAYEYTSGDDTLDIYPAAAQSDTCFIAISDLNAESSIYIPNADVPTVAAELLKAAGHDNLADLVGWESADKKIQERRDEVAAKVFAPWSGTYGEANAAVRQIIDNIIELEDGK